MKFQNLLGMFAVLLIALSGPSYADSFGMEFPTPPALTPTFIDPPTIPESNCGGTKDKCGKVGAREAGESLATGIIIQIIKSELRDAWANGKNLENDFPTIWRLAAWTFAFDVEDFARTVKELLGDGAISYTEPEKVLIKLVAQRAEFSLRTMKAIRLLRTENNPNCDANCKAYIEEKADEVKYYHSTLVEALNDAGIPLLQSRLMPGSRL